jgi:hypothetical protein
MRLVFLAIFAAMLIGLTPSGNVLAGEPGSGCGAGDDLRWLGPPLIGTMRADRVPNGINVTAHFEVSNQNCDLVFDFSFDWPSDELCFGSEEDELCVPGFDDLAAHDIRMMCFQVLDPPECLFSEDPWVQIIAADNLVYSDNDNTFEVNVRMMEVVPR